MTRNFMTILSVHNYEWKCTEMCFRIPLVASLQVHTVQSGHLLSESLSSQLFGIPSIRKYLARKTVMITTTKMMEPEDIPPPAISIFPGTVAAWNVEVYFSTLTMLN